MRIYGNGSPPFADPQFEVEMGSAVLGVAGVAHPTDELTRLDRVSEAFPGAFGVRLHPGVDDVRGDPETETVVGSLGVVVEVQVTSLPAVVLDHEPLMVDIPIRGTLGVEPSDCCDDTVGDGDDRGHLGAHDVDTLMRAGTSVAACPEVVEPGRVRTRNREHEL